jgi:hypothetical protein
MRRYALLLAAACGGSTPATQTKYLASELHLPDSKNDRAADLNGDGTKDNALGGVLGALAGNGVDQQTPEDSAISDGKVVYLFTVSSTDAALANDTAATVTVNAGTPGAPFPGPYTVDASVPAAKFSGAIVNGVFTSTGAVDLTLRLSVYGQIVALPLHGAALTATASPTALTAGRINAALKAADVTGVLVPALAAGLTQSIAADPSSTEAHNIQAIFDKGGCTGATASDSRIDACEVTQAGLISALLAADVQVFDAGGNWAPNSANATPNGWSVGIGFVAASTTF